MTRNNSHANPASASNRRVGRSTALMVNGSNWRGSAAAPFAQQYHPVALAPTQSAYHTHPHSYQHQHGYQHHYGYAGPAQYPIFAAVPPPAAVPHQQNIHAPPPGTEDILSLFVSDLPMRASPEDICAVFCYPMNHLGVDALGKTWIRPFVVTDVRVMPGDGGQSKYAFVRFESVEERQRALTETQGLLCLGTPIRLSRAHSKGNGKGPLSLVLHPPNRSKDQRQRDNVHIDAINLYLAAEDPKNCKVFVGGLPPDANVNGIVDAFAMYGDIATWNKGKGCVFISFERKKDATRAIAEMDGCFFDGKPLRVNWSRTSVQPLLQQTRIFAPVAPDSFSGSDGTNSRRHSRNHSTSTNSVSPDSSSPTMPITPITPSFAASFARGAQGPGSESSSLGRNGSVSLYTVKEEVDEVSEALHGLSMNEDGARISNSSLGLDGLPNMGRRMTIANLSRRRGSTDVERVSSPSNYASILKMGIMGRTSSGGGRKRGIEIASASSNASRAGAGEDEDTELGSIRMARRVSLPGGAL